MHTEVITGKNKGKKIKVDNVSLGQLIMLNLVEDGKFDEKDEELIRETICK